MRKDLINKIRIVLVATTHPGNIGATARAMKTMGIGKLALVASAVFPSAEATARASGADDLLAQASVFTTLEEALAGCGLVYGTSGRRRSISWPVLSPQQAVQQIRDQAGSGTEVAIVFGRESSGLTNAEMDLCHAMIQIPASEDFPSLNIAAAVQVICYELRAAFVHDQDTGHQEETRAPLADIEQMSLFYTTLQEWITEIGYFDPDKPRLLIRRLKRLFNRSRLDENEYNILMGMIAAARKAAGTDH